MDNEILREGTLVADAEYMTPASKDSVWYVRNEVEPIKVDVKKLLIPRLDVHIVTSISELDYSISTMTEDDIIIKEPFKLSDFNCDLILDEKLRRDNIDFDIGEYDEIDTEII